MTIEELRDKINANSNVDMIMGYIGQYIAELDIPDVPLTLREFIKLVDEGK